MNVLYCGDDNMRDGILVSVLSLLAHQGGPLNIYVMTASVTTPRRSFEGIDSLFSEKLSDLLCGERAGSSLTLIDATPQFLENPPLANMDTRFTPCCMLRLYADLMPQLDGLDRILYLDADVLCRQGADVMYGCDMGDAEIGGVLDRYGRWIFRDGLRPQSYLNSGVLLLNMRRIRETGLFARCRELCASETMFMPDQTALNKLAAVKRVFPRRFNEQRRLRCDTVLQHFTTRFGATGLVSIKPWHVDAMHDRLKLHAYDDVLERYQQLAGEFVG